MTKTARIKTRSLRRMRLPTINKVPRREARSLQRMRRPFVKATAEHEGLRADYDGLKLVLSEVSHEDRATLRSLERKHEELQEALWFGEMSYAAARDELFQECYECMPVDA